MKIKSFLMIISMFMALQVQLVHAKSSASDMWEDLKYYQDLAVKKMKDSLPTMTSTEESIFPSINSGQVTCYTTPLWVAHGMHGFYHRVKNYNALEAMQKAGKTELVSTFRKLHPIQSLKTKDPFFRMPIPKVPLKVAIPKIPLIGSLTAAYLTGLSYQVMFGNTAKK